MSKLCLSLFGNFRLRVGEKEATVGHAGVALLSYLAVVGSGSHDCLEIAKMLWDKNQEQQLSSFRDVLRKAQYALEQAGVNAEEIIKSSKGRIIFEAKHIESDVDNFLRLSARGEVEDLEGCRAFILGESLKRFLLSSSWKVSVRQMAPGEAFKTPSTGCRSQYVSAGDLYPAERSPPRYCNGK